MARRGPKPEPAAVKIAKGNPGNRRIGVAPVVEVDLKTVAPPAWLIGDGLTVWDRLAPQLAAMNLLSKIDAETFARYCKNFGRWLKMNTTLDAEGETYESESPHGSYKRAHPAFLIADRLERQLVAAEANFGLNPAERQRIFAARASLGAQGSLFSAKEAPAAPAKSAPAPTNPASKSPLGLLN